MKDYIESLKDPHNFSSGDITLISNIDSPKSLIDKYSIYESLEEEYYTEGKYLPKDEKDLLKDNLIKAKRNFYAELKTVCETYVKSPTLKNNDMARKKKEAAAETPDKEVKKQVQKEETQKKEKRAPQMVTVNGDKVSHAHYFKSNKSDDWFFTAKINDVPLKAKVMSPEDMERMVNKTATVEELMQKYYPMELLPKVAPAEFKLPKTIKTADGEEQIVKFNVYKENDPQKQGYGKYKFYAQVGDKKMSREGSRQDLDAYFNRVATPVNIVTKVFGDRLGMAEHYKQFVLPENIKKEDIRLKKNPATNRFEVAVKLPGMEKPISKEISYEDRQSFMNKVANMEQLAAKYLSAEMVNMPKAERQQTQKETVSMGIK